ncbi:MAG TPA: hypothetical protein VGM23_08270 [Armatimonadota bacterium]
MRRLAIVILWVINGLLPACAVDTVAVQPSPPSLDTVVPADNGFTSDSTLKIDLDEDDIDRYDWWSSHGFTYRMAMVVSLTQGHGVLPGASNKIMLYGDRDEPRFSGEADWSYAPRPLNLLFTPEQKGQGLFVVFGPPCDRPGNLERWTQEYTYTACCNLVNGSSTKTSAHLKVEDSI